MLGETAPVPAGTLSSFPGRVVVDTTLPRHPVFLSQPASWRNEAVGTTSVPLSQNGSALGE